jgi:hypothetical protein
VLPINEHNLLLLVVFTGATVIILLTVTWLSSRTEPFLRTWLVGTVISMVGPLTSAIYYMEPTPWIGAVSFGALAVGFGIKALAAIQFRTGRLALAVLGPVTALVAVAVVAAMLSGRDGLAIILWQGWAFVSCTIAALNYRMAQAEAPVALLLLTFFYLVLGLSFGISALILLLDGSLVLGGPPDNWADRASRLIAVLTLIGIGSVLLTLSHRRLALHRARLAEAGAGRDGNPALNGSA